MNINTNKKNTPYLTSRVGRLGAMKMRQKFY